MLLLFSDARDSDDFLVLFAPFPLLLLDDFVDFEVLLDPFDDLEDFFEDLDEIEGEAVKEGKASKSASAPSFSTAALIDSFASSIPVIISSGSASPGTSIVTVNFRCKLITSIESMDSDDSSRRRLLFPNSQGTHSSMLSETSTSIFFFRGFGSTVFLTAFLISVTNSSLLARLRLSQLLEHRNMSNDTLVEEVGDVVGENVGPSVGNSRSLGSVSEAVGDSDGDVVGD